MFNTLSSKEHSQYVDADGQLLAPDAWVIELSEHSYGRLWQIKEAGSLRYCIAEGMAPIILLRGITSDLRRIWIPSVVSKEELPIWQAKFKQDGGRMWIENPEGNPERIKLTVAAIPHYLFHYETSLLLLQEGPMSIVDNMTAWFWMCLAKFTNRVNSQELDN